MPEASTSYGDKFISYQPLLRQSHSGVWNPREIQNYWESYVQGRSSMTFLSTPAVSPESHEVYKIGWPDKKNPFTQTDLLYNEHEQVQELILEIRTSLSIPYHESLANRLVALFNDAKEEDSASLGIAVGSLRNFHNFLQSNTNLRCPTISLTPEYNIYASWRLEENRVFSVHFLLNGDTRFVIFKPNDRHPERQIRISGTATTDILKETVSPYGVWDWISE